MVESGESAGVCHTGAETRRPLMLPKKSEGMPLRELAQCIFSWNYAEASIGLAAINAYYNTAERFEAFGFALPDSRYSEDRVNDPFITMQREVRGKKVVCIGHFPYIDDLFAPYCDLSIVESTKTQDGDYPKEAAEWLLEGCDYAFIASHCLVDKTLPLYLKACRNAYVTLVSNGSPVSPIFHDFGVDAIAGFLVRDVRFAERVALGLAVKMYGSGQKVILRKAQVLA